MDEKLLKSFRKIKDEVIWNATNLQQKITENQQHEKLVENYETMKENSKRLQQEITKDSNF